MRIGLKRQRVLFERPVETQDATGAQVVEWTPVATVWAEVEPSTTRMRERLAGNQLLADVDTIIRVRWSPALAELGATWRAQLNGVLYNIVGAANVNLRNREYEIMCVSGMNRG